MKKYSRQRELILQSLKNRMDHPTAEMLYTDLKTQIPEMGIATVYRNLTELCKTGQIVKIKPKLGPDRFDANKEEHIHFECNECRGIQDVSIHYTQSQKLDNDIKMLSEKIDAEYENSDIWIYGICKNCKNEKNIKLA